MRLQLYGSRASVGILELPPRGSLQARDLPVSIEHPRRCHPVATKLGPAPVRAPLLSWPGSAGFVGCVSLPAELPVGLEGVEVWPGVVSPWGRAFCPRRTMHGKELAPPDGASHYAVIP